ncbi:MULTISPECIES: hypothetical protein [unclassified Saccharibacter]|uniref:hypothetical protein n=1 Tax=unclassified Saccharibacter TaxID=2648722 RepID=UPI001321459A|nr:MULTISPECIES: hypothetical protein [unclassified Saccharibacter]MXV36939.1 hypothetical protein [Saccharibacter sp. EH611]MXV58571.1 hypothetical protein [Saccharibacter sp. EH70]MXV66077.1 hypothetical protein [Saccharibacter sp. EH60]
MPIADMEGYDPGHFGRVYRNIIIPSCEKAGFNPIRADDVKRTNLIHVDILKYLLSAEMVICDLSGRNPNVLFELGLRQAFDKPTVLMQEKGTAQIFDISSLRYTEYSRHMHYDDVLDVQKKLTNSLEETYAHRDDDSNVNSLIRLLSLTEPAQPKPPKDPQAAQMSMILSELQDLKGLMQATGTMAGQRTLRDTQQEDQTEKLEYLLKTAEIAFQSYTESSDPTIIKDTINNILICHKEASTLAEKNPSLKSLHVVKKIEEYLTRIENKTLSGY